MPTINSIGSDIGIEVTLGGTGNITLTDFGVLVGSGAAAITPLAAGADGTLLIGATGADPAMALLTSTDTTIVFTTGANTLNLESSNSTPTSFATDAGPAVPAAHVLTVAGGTLLNTAGAGSTVTVNADAAVAASFPSDAGTATPAVNVLTVAGGTLLGTTAAGSTVTINADAAVAGSFPTDAGTATPAANALTVAGGTLISSVGAGSTVTLNLDNGTDGQVIIASTAGSPVYATLTAGTNINVTNASNSITIALAGDVSVADGGTGRSVATAFAVICGGTTSTNPHQSIASVGSANDILTSNGAGALPTFQAPAGGGNVTGPGSSTDEAVARFDGAAGTLLQDSVMIVSDTGAVTGVTTLNASGLITGTAGLTITTGATSITSGTNAIDIGTDAAAKTITIGNATGVSSLLLDSGTGGITLDTTSGAGAITLFSGTGAIDIGNDAVAHTITIGNATGATAVNIDSGTAGITLDTTSGAGAITLDSGTGAIDIGTDTVAKTITIGNNTGATSIVIDTGTAGMTVDSATGNIIDIDDSGWINYPLQPAFFGYLPSDDNNVTGDGATYTLGSGTALTEIFDQNGDFTTAGVFTAPVTGRYFLNAALRPEPPTSAMTSGLVGLVTSNRTWGHRWHPFNISTATGNATWPITALADMDSADTCTVTLQIINGASDTVDINGDGAAITYFTGYLVA